MLSTSLMHNVVLFATTATPEVNPYRTTANYIQNFLQPSRLPSWAIYTKYFIGLGFLLMFCLSSHILFVRSKTKKCYDISLNRMGIIQLDCANHCALCYFSYSIIASAQIFCGHLAAAGHIDQPWPNLLLGIKCSITLTCVCNSVVVYLPLFFGKTMDRLIAHV
ncbi:hypothetical protein DFH28DRAFT_101536 [Melampsora americana]|nr:hypothetical protein DFH28DRAFT_101536 [Melampsora americana]